MRCARLRELRSRKRAAAGCVGLYNSHAKTMKSRTPAFLFPSALFGVISPLFFCLRDSSGSKL